MPLYEYYCSKCNTIYTFFSRTISTEKVPRCPECKSATLEKRVSLFAVSSGGRKDEDLTAAGNDLPIDETKMEKAIEKLAAQAGSIDENDPRQAAGLMRRLSEMTGIEYNEKMREAIKRMESGEDPESIEAEMGDALEGEDPIVLPEKKEKAAPKKAPPKRDATMYDM